MAAMYFSVSAGTGRFCLHFWTYDGRIPPLCVQDCRQSLLAPAETDKCDAGRDCMGLGNAEKVVGRVITTDLVQNPDLWQGRVCPLVQNPDLWQSLHCRDLGLLTVAPKIPTCGKLTAATSRDFEPGGTPSAATGRNLGWLVAATTSQTPESVYGLTTSL